jgi:hypothetical protein
MYLIERFLIIHMDQQYIENNVQKCYEFRKISKYYWHHMED